MRTAGKKRTKSSPESGVYFEPAKDSITLMGQQSQKCQQPKLTFEVSESLTVFVPSAQYESK